MRIKDNFWNGWPVLITMIIKFLLNTFLCRLFPVIEAEQSDSGCVDNVVEFLTMAGNRSLPEVITPFSFLFADHFI